MKIISQLLSKNNYKINISNLTKNFLCSDKNFKKSLEVFYLKNLIFYKIIKNAFFLKKERQIEEEKEAKKKIEFLCNEINVKLQNEKKSLMDVLNQKKDLNESLINLEKQVGFKILS